MPEYEVVLADDQDLPSGVNWAIARRPSGGMVAILRKSAICSDMLQEAWAAAEECQHPPRLRVSA